MPVKIGAVRRIAGFLAGALSVLAPSFAAAQSCAFSVSNMNFGVVDTLSGANTDSTATVTMNCTGTAGRRIQICPHLAAGTGGAPSAAARQMASGPNRLDYQLYSDAGHTTVWGSHTWAYASRPPSLALTPNVGGIAAGTATIYGRVPGGQFTAQTGTYVSTFSGPHIEFRYRYSASTSCATGAGAIAPDPVFTVNATVSANCVISILNVDFGSTGALNTNRDANGQVSVRCTPGAVYIVGLNGGLSGSPPTARLMTQGAETVTYGLYRDAARSQPWGDTPGSTVSGTGTGALQNLTVHGRVPPQATPSAGIYSDTVVVTVTY